MFNHTKDFALSSYDYTLPNECIAQSPAIPRESAKLLIYNRTNGKITHSDFYHFSDFVPQDTLLVMNDTQVLRARIYAKKLNPTTFEPNQKNIEIFFHKFVDTSSQPTFSNSLFSTPLNACCLCQMKGRIKEGDTLLLTALCMPKVYIKILSCLENGMRLVAFFTCDDVSKNLAPKSLNQSEVLTLLETYGHIPLPPYIKRDDTAQDELYYQSVFAKNLGSIAAPTASLHFSTQSLETLRSRFQLCFITLHVGAGTFMSVEAQDIRHHQIHTEFFSITQESAQAINNAKKVLCIGTTAARCVEYHTRHKVLSGECDIFLYPGVEFQRVDYLLTNFHLPKSTLLMLVSAMIGREKALELYILAQKMGYRFYSYGDGMLIL